MDCWLLLPYISNEQNGVEFCLSCMSAVCEGLVVLQLFTHGLGLWCSLSQEFMFTGSAHKHGRNG